MKSLSTRLTIWYAIAVTLSAAIFMLFGRFLIERSYIEGVDQLNDKEFEEIRNRAKPLLEAGRDAEAFEAIREHSVLDAALFFFQVGLDHEHPVFTSSNLGPYSLPEAVHRRQRSTIVLHEFGRLRVGEYDLAGYDVNVASSLNGLEGLFANLYRIGIGSLAVVFILSLGLGRFLSRMALQPVAQMQRTASQISARNLSERIQIADTGDELSKLGGLLNTMFDRLERSFTEIQKFTADASHELKTPLSLIRLSSEKIRNSLENADAETVQLLENQLEMIDRLNKVVDDLLVLAKADAGSLNLSRKRIDVSEFLKEFSQDAQALCENACLHFDFENTCHSQISGDKVWLYHVLFNLISNAIKFSPRDGRIKMESSTAGAHWQLVLQDDGPGIPEEKLQLVFRRFFSEPDPSEGRGSGLGLSLCQSIIRLHDGDIQLSNRQTHSGLLVRITLPLLLDA